MLVLIIKGKENKSYSQTREGGALPRVTSIGARRLIFVSSLAFASDDTRIWVPELAFRAQQNRIMDLHRQSSY